MRKIIKTVIACGFLALVALSITGCATNVATGKTDLMLVSEEDESKLGLEEHEGFVKSKGLYSDKELQDYVQKVGNKIVQVSDRSNIQYQFFVLNKPEVNAFALPNGYIYVTRGLLAYLNSEDELAAVLAHEVSHVAARHTSQLLSSAKVAGATSTIVGMIAGIAVAAATGDINLAQSSMNLSSNMSSMAGVLVIGNYSREHELEADQLGASYLARAGYPPQAMVSVLNTLQSVENFEAVRLANGGKKQQMYHQALATHPELQERIEKISVPLDGAQRHDEETSHAEYLEKISGLVFEPFDEARPAQGGVTTWLNRETLFQIYLPADWAVIESSKEGVTIEKAQDQVRTDIRLLPPQSDQDPQSFFSGPLVGAIAIKDLKPLTHVYHKNPAFSAMADLKIADVEQHAYISVLFNEKYTILITGTNKDPAWIDSHRYVFDAQTNLTKILTQDEYNQIRIKRIKVVNAHEGDSYSGLATASPLGAASEDYLRLINHQYPAGEPTTEQLIKTVVAD